jgi:hypothetical protein
LQFPFEHSLAGCGILAKPDRERHRNLVPKNLGDCEQTLPIILFKRPDLSA